KAEGCFALDLRAGLVRIAPGDRGDDREPPRRGASGLRAGQAVNLWSEHHGCVYFARPDRAAPGAARDGAVRAWKNHGIGKERCVGRSGRAGTKAIPPAQFDACGGKRSAALLATRLRRVACSADVSMSRGILDTTGPISQPSPVGMLRESVKASHS